ncbi:glycosyltransferase family 4 protein [Puniceicoccales bacterium CK1056]|uniref:Glycosyltransferase family 4 protein n=1 Tax=Oceanipulchritudo coccoides TaxID=2706888 RepID=A0A6B2M156_9BACT|nr:glycosyltransferase [Oceanipulchritudo coccoides]NDV61787.1 glycosyltransferase family 4 protein [Oceanipulchritudo coccoides]
MKLALFTNTYSPHVGGVAKSVAALVKGMRARNHEVLVVAPEFENQPKDELSVVRIPSIHNFNGTDFSFKLPSGNRIGEAIKAFHPDIIHSHHPFLLGDAAMRMAHQWQVPIVFTHHTRYEDYVHYVIDDFEYLERLAIELATEYANLCDRVIAPSNSIKDLITKRGVKVPVSSIPTGIDHEQFKSGDGLKIRKQLGIAEDRFVIGHVGRLANEKNLPYLVEAVCAYLKGAQDAEFLLVGKGDSLDRIKATMHEERLDKRVHYLGKLDRQDLVDSYHAMDLFAFSSKSETQGMVLAEAMAAGTPVIALDASGSRDIINDWKNGRLMPEASNPESFARGIGELRKLASENSQELHENMRTTAEKFSESACLYRVEALYHELREEEQISPDIKSFDRFANRIEAEWEIAISRARAIGVALRGAD